MCYVASSGLDPMGNGELLCGLGGEHDVNRKMGPGKPILQLYLECYVS